MNMPNENIKRAIQRGAGTGEDAVRFEEITYEGYGPGGAAVIVDALTDSRNRTSAELRTVFTRNGGSLGEPGSVAWGFMPAGLIQFDRKRHDEESLVAAALEAGADDLRTTESTYDIVTSPAQFEGVKAALIAKGLQPTSAEVVKLPKNTVMLEGKNAEQMVRLLEMLEEHDDVQHVWANFDISEKLLESLMGSGKE
jgi:YebC/PmpR family DNA-binding regulatory protein